MRQLFVALNDKGKLESVAHGKNMQLMVGGNLAELAARYPLAMISPPARNFLNSTFVNVKSLRDIEGEPRLEIHADDVKCAHGCAVGELDAMGLFYLQSRGVPKRVAQSLLVLAKEPCSVWRLVIATSPGLQMIGTASGRRSPTSSARTSTTRRSWR